MTRRPEVVKIQYMDVVIDYEYEYIGCNPRLILTPQVKTCWAAAIQANNTYSSLCLMGVNHSGKTQILKDLSQQLGKFCVVVSCNSWYNYKTLHQIFLGVSQTGVDFFNIRFGACWTTSTN